MTPSPRRMDPIDDPIHIPDGPSPVSTGSRLLEIGLSILASMVSTAAVTTWYLSALLTQLQDRGIDHERRISQIEIAVKKGGEDGAMMIARENATDTYRQETNARLSQIESKIDRLLEGRRREDR